MEQRQISSANSALEYRHEKLISQLNHRFVRDANYDLDHKGQVTDLNQIGLLLTTPLDDRWHLYGGYYQELNQNVKVDRKGGSEIRLLLLEHQLQPGMGQHARQREPDPDVRAQPRHSI